MLTFFDYLKQRALESILAGVWEALEILEKEKRFSESPSSQPEAAGNPPARTTSGHSLEDDDPLPAPRQRGRPERGQKRK